MPRDLTPQEFVKEASKLVGIVEMSYNTFRRGHWYVDWFTAGEKVVCAKTLRSCLAKLKKEVGK